MDAENTEQTTQEQEPVAVESTEPEAPEPETPEPEGPEDLFSLDDDDDEPEEEQPDAVQEEPEGAEEPEAEEEVAEQPVVAEQPEPRTGTTKYGVKEITAEAKRLVEESTGKAFDEFDPEHIVALTMESQRLVRKLDNHQAAVAEAEKIKAAHGGEAFAKQWQAYMGDMRHADAKAMLDAESAGDYSLTLKHLKSCAAKQKAANMGAPSNAPATQRNKPPVTMPAGNGSAPARRKDNSVFSLDEF